MGRLFSAIGFLSAICILAACSSREMVQECQIPETDAVIRLYRSTGNSVTVSDGWDVTFQEGSFHEKRIFSAYSSPSIDTIRCNRDEIVLLQTHEDRIIKEYILPLEWVREDLVHKPLRFYKMTLRSLEYSDEIRDWVDIEIPVPSPTP